MLHGHPDQADRDAREARVIAAGKEGATNAGIIDINPEWDEKFMADCISGESTRFDAYDADTMDDEAGHSSHEVRTWVAAFSALAAASSFALTTLPTDWAWLSAACAPLLWAFLAASPACAAVSFSP